MKEIENNKVVVLDENRRIVSEENFPSAEAAYEYYIDSIRVLKERLKKGAAATVARMRWDRVMTMETIKN